MFKIISDFPSYEVNKEGVIRRVSDGYVMTHQLNVDGYPVVYLRLNGKNHCKRVHRLVAIAFIPNPENFPVVNHLDSNRANCHVSNLEWTTVRGNIIHSIESNGIEYKFAAKISKEDAHEICKLLEQGNTPRKIYTNFGYSQDIAQKILSKKAWVDISVNYKFPEYSMKTKVSSVVWICEAINEGLSNRQIVEMRHDPEITIDVVKKIRNGKTHTHITKHILEKASTISRETYTQVSGNGENLNV